VGDDELQTFLRQWWEGVWGEGDIALVDELVTPTFVAHSAAGTEHLTRTELKERLAEAQRHLHHTATAIDDIAIEGERVWIRATSRGVDRETGEPALQTWLVVYRFEEGLLAESWMASVPEVDWES
jgi:ketosteroid isomerase-like protein